MTSDYNKALNLPKDMDIYLNDLPETKNYLSDMVLYNGYAVYLYKSFFRLTTGEWKDYSNDIQYGIEKITFNLKLLWELNTRYTKP